MRSINESLHTEFANSGRAAGMGISEDRYDDESYGPEYCHETGPVRFPSDSLTPEEWAAMNGPVITVKETKNEAHASELRPKLIEYLTNEDTGA